MSLLSWRWKEFFVAIPTLCVAGPLLAVEPSTADLEKELAALAEIPNWSLTTMLSAASGYKDNILLSSSNPVGSGFFRGEAEATLLRLPTAGLDGYVFLNVIETRFFSAQQTDHERTAFLVGEVRWEPSDALKWSFQAQGYHQDQVFDVSTTEISLDTSVLKITGFSLMPGVRWNFSRMTSPIAATIPMTAVNVERASEPALPEARAMDC